MPSTPPDPRGRAGQRAVQDFASALTRGPAERGNPRSRPPSRRCAGSASTPGASASSPPPLSCFSITRSPARPDDIIPPPASRYREWLNEALLVGDRVVLLSADGRRVDAFHR